MPQIPPDPPGSPCGGPATPSDWRGAFLAEYEIRGGFFRSAQAAGIDSTTVRAHAARDPEFAAQVEQARQLYADSVAYTLVEGSRATGNPVGQIVALKALRPMEYIERHASLNVYADLTPGDGGDARAMLATMLGSLTPATHLMLSAPQEPPG